MITYIAFSKKTHKIYARLFCKRFRHCAPIIKTRTGFILYQFVNRNNIVPLKIKSRDLEILKNHGWIFVPYKTHKKTTLSTNPITCVQFTKKICHIKNWKIQTPDQLFKFICNKKCPKRTFFI